MLSNKHIAAIHAAKTHAGLSDGEYRKVLFEVAGVETSKDVSLGDREFSAIMDRLKTDKPGWKYGQIKKFRQYAKFCKMSEVESRQELYKVTGQMNEDSPQLNNQDFDNMMPELETVLDNLINAGKAETPKGLDIRYWRGRVPNGKLTSRQDWEIRSLWADVKEYFSEEKRSFNYLCGFISRALGLKLDITDLAQLKSWQAVKAIDALKLRLEQEQNKLEKEVPF